MVIELDGSQHYEEKELKKTKNEQNSYKSMVLLLFALPIMILAETSVGYASI